MMKKTIRYSALLLALVLLAASVCLISCGREEGVPDGMMSVTCPGANYRLFVPENWTPKTGSGVSGAFVTLNRLSDVSAYQKDVPAGTTAADVWEECLAGYISRYPDLEVLNNSENAMGGLTAPVYVFGFTRGEEKIRCMQVTAVSEATNIAYVFLFTATEEMYDGYIDQIYEIVSQILLDQAPVPAGASEYAHPESTPDGMWCISDKKVAYYFFIPTDWKPLKDTDIVDAKAPSDPSNVSLTVYIDGDVTDAETWREKMETAWADDGYTLGEITGAETVMGGVEGKTFTYEVTLPDGTGEVYRLSQTVVLQDDFLFGPTAYVLTYTATPDSFDTHTAEVNAMREAFSFR